jgi:uncharacterized repeat protein (TIGR02059 family)
MYSSRCFVFMRFRLVLFFIVLSLLCSANTYYVSTTGSNSYPGTITQPFLTIQYGVDHLASPGDILYIRGGTYSSSGGTAVNIGSSNGSGTSSSHKVVSNYQNEVVILDGSNLTNSSVHFGLHVTNISYWDFKGINISNVFEYNQGEQYGIGFEMANCNNILVERCSVYNCGGGFTCAWSDLITYNNCDAYSNADLLDNGGYANGFSGHIHGASVLTYNNCRAWANSDDGFDLYGSSGYITINNCWAFKNGYGNAYNGFQDGNGAGIKTGANDTQLEAGVQRTINNCLMWNNNGYGFDKSQDGGPSMLHNFINNTIYNNVVALNFQYSGASDIIRNNICHANATFYPINSNNTVDHNNFTSTSQNGVISVTDADFLSIDPAGTDGIRQADGSLPVLNFLNLSKGSKLIDAGVDIGIPYSGNAPDLGAYEFQAATNAIPAFINSSIENVSPNKLEMNYNMSLSNNVPLPQVSAFTVRVNSAARNINVVSVSGSKVVLTLVSDVVYGDLVTVAYTKPATNALQTASGAQVATMNAQAVTNNIILSPVFVSSSIENASPTILEMKYDLALANIVPSLTAFSVIVNSAARTVNSVAVSGTKVQLTLSTPVVYNDNISVSYTKPASNPLQNPAGGLAATFSARAVTNNVNPVVAVQAPVYVSSAIENLTPAVLEMKFDLTLANIVPLSSNFVVKVNSLDRPVNSVSVSGTVVKLTLSIPIVYTDIITVAYIKPASNSIQTPSGGQAATLTAQKVTNNVTPLYPVSAVIENLTPNKLEITFNEVLDKSLPSVSAFIVQVNEVSRAVTEVSIDQGFKVFLTLISPVAYGDKVTFTYTKPASNPLVKASGVPALSLGPLYVTNNVTDILAKSLLKNIISINPNPATNHYIIITFSELISEPLNIRIFDLTGKPCSEIKLNPSVSTIKIPIYLKSGLYIVQVSNSSATLLSQKLIVSN